MTFAEMEREVKVIGSPQWVSMNLKKYGINRNVILKEKGRKSQCL